jgi:hypothetical protein
VYITKLIATYHSICNPLDATAWLPNAEIAGCDDNDGKPVLYM